MQIVYVQDPVVFSGTVRDNLDPFGASAGDSAIWGALRQTGMADTITHLVSIAFSLLQQVKGSAVPYALRRAASMHLPIPDCLVEPYKRCSALD